MRRNSKTSNAQYNAVPIVLSQTSQNIVQPLHESMDQQRPFVEKTADGEYINNLQLMLQQAMIEIDQLKNQVLILQEQNKNLSQTQNEEMTKNKSHSPINTDEEEEIIMRETNWLLPRNRNKKRKATESPEKDTDNCKKQTKNTTKAIKPPPVILSNFDDNNAVNNKLNNANINYNTNMLNGKQIKINVSSDEDSFNE